MGSHNGNQNFNHKKQIGKISTHLLIQLGRPIVYIPNYFKVNSLFLKSVIKGEGLRLTDLILLSIDQCPNANLYFDPMLRSTKQ